MQAEAEAMEMKMKGYTYQQETARQVGLEAMKNGITGNGSGGGNALGDVASLGVTLGAMGGVIGMTKEAMSPIWDNASQIGQGLAGADSRTWNCACGQTQIVSNYCPNCGAKRPEPSPASSWDCPCGQTGITSNFCPNCGTKRPAAGWDCSCGQTGIVGNFCPNCGKKRGE